MTQKSKPNCEPSVTLKAREMKSVLMEQPDFLVPIVERQLNFSSDGYWFGGGLGMMGQRFCWRLSGLGSGRGQ